MGAVLGHAPACSDVVRRLVGKLSAAMASADLVPTGAFVRVLASSRAGYFTLNVRQVVVAAMCVAVLANVVRRR